MVVPPIKELLAAEALVQSMVPRADNKAPYPMWHGWVITEAFLAGIQWERERQEQETRGSIDGGRNAG